MSTKIVVLNGKRYRVRLARKTRSNPTASDVQRGVDSTTLELLRKIRSAKQRGDHRAHTHYVRELAQLRERMRSNPGRGSYDEHAATELRLYVDNEGDLYRGHTQAVHNNLARKYLKGTYDHAKAPILWGYLVDAGAKKYAKEFASPADWNTIFTKATRDHVAKEMADDFLAELKAGNYTPDKIKRSAPTPQTRYLVLNANGGVLKRLSNKADAIKFFKYAGGKPAGLTIIRADPHR